jgi:hypothetical protein
VQGDSPSPRSLADQGQGIVECRRESDADPANRIAAEVARLTDAFSAFLDRDAHSIRQDFFRLKPRWPIEAMAMRLALDAFEESVKQNARADRQAR